VSNKVSITVCNDSRSYRISNEAAAFTNTLRCINDSADFHEGCRVYALCRVPSSSYVRFCIRPRTSRTLSYLCDSGAGVSDHKHTTYGGLPRFLDIYYQRPSALTPGLPDDVIG